MQMKGFFFFSFPILSSYLFVAYIIIGRREKCGVKYIKKAIKPFVNKKLTLPSDALSLPTVTIIGDKRVAIEQHYKLISFTEKRSEEHTSELQSRFDLV